MRTTTLPAAPAAGELALRVRGLGLQVGQRWLVRDVDLDLIAGRLLVVVGPNGAGKSTLLSLLAADVTPTTGSVEFGPFQFAGASSMTGVPAAGLRALDLSRRRAVLLQQNSLSFPFTVGDVVAMGRAPWRGTEREDDDEEAIAEALRSSDLQAFSTRHFPSLSGGEQERAAYARTKAQQCGLMLLDEPTSALDLRHQEQFMADARASADAGACVLIVLHDLQLAAAYADEIAVLCDGALVARGTPTEVLTEELLSQTYGLAIDVLHHPVTEALLIAPRRTRSARSAHNKGET